MQPQGTVHKDANKEVSGRHLVSHVEDLSHQSHKQQADLLGSFTYGLSRR